ncbi:sensor histidine kinase [Natronococcus jeotgali]|uniref:histidine kinase n=1 Tax=Natronococcus jeotgali DSM 18795 TaxID=1227498 RepID=L9X956_9EURY|nr:ATP-binding protein [Natronococcus jeotgali]ELY58255.1 multi-sensor signal transduction histidine kinase [Natronococcus jeotgali DSM 18795]
MNGRSVLRWGPAAVGILFILSLGVSVYHLWAHDAPLVPTILGQWSLVALSALFGLAGYYAFANVKGSSGYDIIGTRTTGGYVLAGLASGGYSLHQHLTPEAAIDPDVILFQATFVTLVGGVGGLVVGLETARRKQSIAELEATTTELESTQAQIRTEKQRFESLFQNAPSAIVDLRYSDGELTVVRANAVFEEFPGHTSAAAEGENLFETVPLRETETESEVRAHIAEQESYETEVTVDRSSGGGHYKLRVVPYEVGTANRRAFALYTDVTELRRTKQELNESVERLEASNERLEQFAYAVSHDLQEPLRMISSYLELLEDRYEDALDEDAAEFIEFAVDGADRMQAMIESLLEYSRVETRGAPFEPTDAEAVLEDVLTDLQPHIEESEATITVEELPTVTADADQLAQVFRNLVSNALKYSGDEAPQIQVGAERADGKWQFAVADQGIGIDPEQRERIFDVFQTAHTDEEGSDSGIGLALCDRIAERHGGEIWVESEPGNGAIFHFTMPASGEQPTVVGNSSSTRGE